MHRWLWFLFWFGISCEVKSQAFSVFPQNKRIDAWEQLLNSDSLNGPKTYQFGALNGSYFESVIGGNNLHLWAIKWASSSQYLDSSPWKPLIIADFYSESDTLKNVVWLAHDLDSAVNNPQWVEQVLLNNTNWRSIAWEERWQRTDSFAYFVLRDYLLPLPCHHETIYMNYLGPDDIELSIDLDAARGLNFEECYEFIYEQLEHLKAFHEPQCRTQPLITIEVGIKNAPIHEIRAFIQVMSRLGARVELVFPWEP